MLDAAFGGRVAFEAIHPVFSADAFSYKCFVFLDEPGSEANVGPRGIHVHYAALSGQGIDDSFEGYAVVGDRGIFNMQVLYFVLHDMLEYLFYSFYVKYFVIYDILYCSAEFGRIACFLRC